MPTPPIWHAHSDPLDENPNIDVLNARIEAFARTLPERLAAGTDPAPAAGLYHDLCLYLLFASVEPDLKRWIVGDGATTWAGFAGFTRDVGHRLDFPALAPTPTPPGSSPSSSRSAAPSTSPTRTSSAAPAPPSPCAPPSGRPSSPAPCTATPAPLRPHARHHHPDRRPLRQRQGTGRPRHRGTVLLDEIGDTDATVQVKLVRVLQSRTFQRVGDTKDRAFRGKIVAAANRRLAEEMQRLARKPCWSWP